MESPWAQQQTCVRWDLFFIKWGLYIKKTVDLNLANCTTHASSQGQTKAFLAFLVKSIKWLWMSQGVILQSLIFHLVLTQQMRIFSLVRLFYFYVRVFSLCPREVVIVFYVWLVYCPRIIGRDHFWEITLPPRYKKASAGRKNYSF